MGDTPFSEEYEVPDFEGRASKIFSSGDDSFRSPFSDFRNVLPGITDIFCRRRDMSVVTTPVNIVSKNCEFRLEMGKQEPDKLKEVGAAPQDMEDPPFVAIKTKHDRRRTRINCIPPLPVLPFSKRLLGF